MDVSVYAVNVVMMLGIGLGIDYGLLDRQPLPRRARCGPRRRRSGRRRPCATAAGRSCSRLHRRGRARRPARVRGPDDAVNRDRRHQRRARVMAAALTLLPALLARFGHRLRPAAAASDHGGFARLSRFVTRALPARGRRRELRARAPRGAVPRRPLRRPRRAARFPESSESRQVAETIDARFGGVTAGADRGGHRRGRRRGRARRLRRRRQPGSTASVPRRSSSRPPMACTWSRCPRPGSRTDRTRSDSSVRSASSARRSRIGWAATPRRPSTSDTRCRPGSARARHRSRSPRSSCCSS